jgi:hypothetical protein
MISRRRRLAAASLGQEYLEKIGGGEDPAGVLARGCRDRAPVSAFPAWCMPATPGSRSRRRRSCRHRPANAPRSTSCSRFTKPSRAAFPPNSLLCGRGMMNIYRAVCKANGKTKVATTPAEVTAHWSDGSDPAAVEAIELFRHLSGPRCGRSGADLHGPRRRFPRRRHRPEDHPRAPIRASARHSRTRRPHTAILEERSRPSSSPIRLPRCRAWRPMPAPRCALALPPKADAGRHRQTGFNPL